MKKKNSFELKTRNFVLKTYKLLKNQEKEMKIKKKISSRIADFPNDIDLELSNILKYKI